LYVDLEATPAFFHRDSHALTYFLLSISVLSSPFLEAESCHCIVFLLKAFCELIAISSCLGYFQLSVIGLRRYYAYKDHTRCVLMPEREAMSATLLSLLAVSYYYYAMALSRPIASRRTPADARTTAVFRPAAMPYAAAVFA